jgi:uncharacterized protein
MVFIVKRFALVLLLLSFIIQAKAQDEVLLNSRELINKALAGVEKEKYEEAIAYLDKVYKSDSNYVEALLEKTFVYAKSKQFEKAVATAKLGIAENDVLGPRFYNNLGYSLEQLEKTVEASQLYDEAIAKYPMHYLAYHNKGELLEEGKKYDEALGYFIKALKLYPGHIASHIKIGNIAAKSGYMVEALLAYNTAILINPYTERANSVLSYINTFLGSNAAKEDGYEFNYTGQLFEEVELLVENRVALQKKYKVIPKIDLAYIKQNHLLLQ